MTVIQCVVDVVSFHAQRDELVAVDSAGSCVGDRSSRVRYECRLHTKPIDGNANKAIIALVAKHYGVSKTRVSIKKTSLRRRTKIVLVDLGDV